MTKPNPGRTWNISAALRPHDAPAIGDALVSDGTKYRIRELTPHAAHLAAAGPNWRRTPVIRLADPSRLTYDKVAGLWRGPTVEAIR